MNYRSIIFGGVACLCSVIGRPTCTLAQVTTAQSTSELPPDPNLKVGTLKNGLTYFIRANNRPAKTAELRLIVRVGSNHENYDQRGLAHFVEHMAFNGTKRYPGNTLQSTLELEGVKFGGDLNASTTNERTVYELRLPTAKPGLIGRGIDVLAEWASAVTFDSLKVVKERGVILAERRTNMGTTANRLRLEAIFAGSRYAERPPIGDSAIITTVNPSALKKFYNDWYRPNLMGVVVVGDFSADDVERMVREQFGRLKNPPNAPVRETYRLEDNVEPRISVVPDSAAVLLNVAVHYKLPNGPKDMTERTRLGLARSLFVSGVNERLDDAARSLDGPFRGAHVSFASFNETLAGMSISVTPETASPIAGFNAALAEIERIARFGLTEDELIRLRAEREEIFKRGESDTSRSQSGAYTSAYINAFLYGETFVPDPVATTRLNQQVLATITNADIQNAASLWRTPENRIFVITAPARADAIVPSKFSLLNVFSDVAKMPLAARQDSADSRSILATLPTPGTIVERRSREHGISEWTLSNGIHVFLKRTTDTKNGIYIGGDSPGGYLLNLDQGFASAGSAAGALRLGGTGRFTADEIQKRLKTVIGDVSWEIGPFRESGYAVGRWDNVELLFQLLHLSFTQPRVDTARVAAWVQQYKRDHHNRPASPEAAFRDTILMTLVQNHPIFRAGVEMRADSIDLKKALKVFQDRFGDMSDFQFVITGNFSADSIEPFVTRYLASLPGGGRVETWKDVGARPPSGVIHKVLRTGKEPKTTNRISFYGPAEVTPQTQWNLQGMGEIIEGRLRRRLREELGLVYSVGVSATVTYQPYSAYRIDITFSTAPEKSDEAAAEALAILAQMQQAPALETEIETVRKAHDEIAPLLHESILWWYEKIQLFNTLKMPFSEIGSDAVLRAWNGKDVQTAAQRYLDFNNFARFELAPEGSNDARSTANSK